jgi:hypothetical protein
MVAHILGSGTLGIAQSTQLDRLETRFLNFQEETSKNMQLILTLLRDGSKGKSPPDPGGANRPSIHDTTDIKENLSYNAGASVSLLHAHDNIPDLFTNSDVLLPRRVCTPANAGLDAVTACGVSSVPTYMPKRTLEDTFTGGEDYDHTLPDSPLAATRKKARMQLNTATQLTQTVEAAKFGAILMEHIRGLRDTIGEPNASYRSNDQYEVFCSLLRREQHIIHISRTGGGKTLPFQLALKCWDPSVKGIIVLPYVVLYEPFKRRFDAVGLGAQICNAKEKLDPNARVYIVGLNQFLSPKLQEAFRVLAAKNRLGAIMLDEVDGAVVDSDFRPHFRWSFEKALQLPNTVCLFASATIPAMFENEWFRHLSLTSAAHPDQCNGERGGEHWGCEDAAAIRVVRSRSTDRLNITYRIDTYDTHRQHDERLEKGCCSRITHHRIRRQTRERERTQHASRAVSGLIMHGIMLKTLPIISACIKAVQHQYYSK